MRRTTLYERSEVENAAPPKKRHPKRLGHPGKHIAQAEKAQSADTIEKASYDIGKRETRLEEQCLALEEKRLEVDRELLEMAKRMVEILGSNTDIATRAVIRESLRAIISRLTGNQEPKSVLLQLQFPNDLNLEEEKREITEPAPH